MNKEWYIYIYKIVYRLMTFDWFIEVGSDNNKNTSAKAQKLIVWFGNFYGGEFCAYLAGGCQCWFNTWKSLKYVRLRENFLWTPSFWTAFQVPLSSNANRLEFSECVVYIIVLKKKKASNLILAIKQSGHIDFFFSYPSPSCWGQEIFLYWSWGTLEK